MPSYTRMLLPSIVYRSIKLPSPESESRTRAGVRRRVRPQFAGRTLGWAGSSPTGLLAGGGPWKLGAPCDRPARSPRSTGLREVTAALEEYATAAASR